MPFPARQTISPQSSATDPVRTIPEAEWIEARNRHLERLAPWVGPHLARGKLGEKHPVYDFLFDYNGLRASHLLRWHPGAGVLLAGDQADEYLSHRYYARFPGGIGVASATLPSARRKSVAWLLTLLEGCRERPPQFGCFGLHEWAMVYRSPEVRHSAWPLRLSPEEIAEVVEASSLRCSHYDAFRFFTSAARPRNQFQLTRPDQTNLDQRGCLHVNMDLCKWAYKLLPWASSELLADTFVLAAEIREIDMRASPYDFRSLGFEPILIETPEGRTCYERHQREFAARSEPLRQALIDLCIDLLKSDPE